MKTILDCIASFATRRSIYGKEDEFPAIPRETGTRGHTHFWQFTPARERRSRCPLEPVLARALVQIATAGGHGSRRAWVHNVFT